MKYIGIDYGTRSIGIAVSDGDGKIAFPREEIANSGDAVKKISDIVQKEGVEMIVIGDTRALSGAENAITKEAESFADSLEAAGFAVRKVSEAWSSAEAMRFAPKGKTHDNSAAAAIILQRFLDMRP